MTSTPRNANAAAGQAWMAAAEAGDVASLRSLLTEHPHLLNTRLEHQTFKQSTALHLAVWKGHDAAVQLLVDHGADIELQDQTGMTALQIDVMRICLQKMRPTVLLRSRYFYNEANTAHCCSPEVRDRSTYRDIDTGVLDLLLAHKACVDQLNEVRRCQLHPFQALQFGDTALLNVVEYGLTKHVEKLLAHGADPSVYDNNGRSAMDIAGEHGFADIVDVLAENCPGLVNTVGEKTLVMAVRHEFSTILETLYDRVQDRMSHDEGVELGGRLLHVAAEYDAPSCALFLLKRGIPMGWTNEEGKTPVQVACARGRSKILATLLDSNPSGNENVDSSNASSDAAVLTHPCVKMDVLQSCGNSLSLLRDWPSQFPVFVTVKMPANSEVMEVLIRHSAKFDFPTQKSRDSVVPLLASWLLCVEPSDASALLVDLATSGSIRHKQLRHVILALTWQEYVYEALLVALVLLVTPQAVDVEQALVVFKPWMIRCELNLVTRKLLTDALKL